MNSQNVGPHAPFIISKLIFGALFASLVSTALSHATGLDFNPVQFSASVLFHIPLGVYPMLVAVKQKRLGPKCILYGTRVVCTLRNKGCTALFFIIHFALFYIICLETKVLVQWRKTAVCWIRNATAPHFPAQPIHSNICVCVSRKKLSLLFRVEIQDAITKTLLLSAEFCSYMVETWHWKKSHRLIVWKGGVCCIVFKAAIFTSAGWNLCDSE